jgi:phospholipid/cholesterol/gamma-HCH transport system substrate-binding protein/paraquat-inducible protein B
VGLFVFVGIALIFGFVILLAGRSMFRTPVVFETYFDEPVTGLEVGSAVKVRGVPLGSVSRIDFVRNAYELPQRTQLAEGQLVLVEMKLIPPEGEQRDEEARLQRLNNLIERGLRLRLSTQGITGVSFIQADFLDPEIHPPMEIFWTPRNIYVPSAPSTLQSISSAAERIFRRLEDTDVEGLLNNLDGLIVGLKGQVDQMDAGQVRRDLVEFIAELRGTNARLQRTLDGTRYDLEVAVENLRVTSENLRDLTDTAREYPSYLILGEPPKPAQGPRQ